MSTNCSTTKAMKSVTLKYQNKSIDLLDTIGQFDSQSGYNYDIANVIALNHVFHNNDKIKLLLLISLIDAKAVSGSIIRKSITAILNMVSDIEDYHESIYVMFTQLVVNN